MWASILAERDVSEANPPEGLALVAFMLVWYSTSRVEGVDLDADGDTLLFQWGTYDWGSGPTFQIDITRQLIGVPDGNHDDGAMWQLSSTLHYSIGPDATATGAGDRWCYSPADVGAFDEYIQGTAAAAFARSRRADRVEVHFGEV